MSPDPMLTAALASEYRLLRRLRADRTGTIYLAEQVRVGHRKVALTILHPRVAEDEAFIARWQDAVACAGHITHPNVVTLYECQQTADGTRYIATEFVEGESLTERLHERGRLPLDDVVEITSQCGKALQAAHRLGILHRGITPDTVMLTRDPDGALCVKLGGFGIEALRDTASGDAPGTPAYCSYEQASGLSPDQLDARSDVYALGLVTYAMLAGRPPFAAKTAMECLARHLFEAPPPLEPERPDLPPAAAAAVMRALEKDRRRRYQTAAEFAGALRAAVEAPSPGCARAEAPPGRSASTRPEAASAVSAPAPPPANPPAGTPRAAAGEHEGARPWGPTPTPAGPGGAAVRAEIDDARRSAVLNTVAHDLVADGRVAECRTVLEGQWCAVSLEVRQLRLPPFHLARVDVDGAVRGAASAIMLVRAVFAGAPELLQLTHAALGCRLALSPFQPAPRREPVRILAGGPA